MTSVSLEKDLRVDIELWIYDLERASTTDLKPVVVLFNLFKIKI